MENALSTHLFAAGLLSPVDEWTLELSLSDNAFLRSVGTADSEQISLAEIQDVVLALEYETACEFVGRHQRRQGSWCAQIVGPIARWTAPQTAD